MNKHQTKKTLWEKKEDKNEADVETVDSSNDEYKTKAKIPIFSEEQIRERQKNQ